MDRHQAGKAPKKLGSSAVDHEHQRGGRDDLVVTLYFEVVLVVGLSILLLNAALVEPSVEEP